MQVELESSSPLTISNSASGDASISSSGQQITPITNKKKRNLPGMPDPEAEVIALSPRTLMATNRFVCEVCSKGFQRDQNLQLHRRGHNLPWKLRQRNGNEVRKRVYVCPELTCVHHSPARALGDLTGVKKHFCRKHGEKKWKCDKCSKKYAVQSDCKAHFKTCGTREYRCDCGTFFSRRDSFITHRAFCDALVVESAKVQTNTEVVNPVTEEVRDLVAPPLQQQESVNTAEIFQQIPPPVTISGNSLTSTTTCRSNSSSSNNSSTTSLFATLFASTAATTAAAKSTTTFSDLIGAMNRSDPVQPTLERCQFAPPPPSPHLSATALLQKAAEMGAVSATHGLSLRGFGLSNSSPGDLEVSLPWDESLRLSAGLGLGLPYDGGAGMPELMMGSSSVFDEKPATLDFLGLGVGPGGSGGFSALISSMGGELDVATGGFGGGSSPGETWERAERKPSSAGLL